MEFREDICNAIRNKQRIEFVYHDKFRKGNLQCYGVSRTGKQAIRVHLLEGGDRPEQLFLLDKTSSFKILNERFSSPGPNYHKGDQDMDIIFCEL